MPRAFLADFNECSCLQQNFSNSEQHYRTAEQQHYSTVAQQHPGCRVNSLNKEEKVIDVY